MPKTRRVLLIEDDEPSALYVATVLELAGCSVRKISDGVEATEVALQDRFDVILMDFHLPNRQGSEVARLIRIAESLSGGTPRIIVGITASAMPHEVEAFHKSGMDDVMTKPLSMEQLHEMLDRWVPRSVIAVRPTTRATEGDSEPPRSG